MVGTRELFSTRLLKALPATEAQRQNEMSRPINFSTVPDDELKAANTSVLVLNAYALTMALRRDERRAFEAALRAWQERNPNAGREEASPAVADILCHKL
jgi:hypothetical protein